GWRTGRPTTVLACRSEPGKNTCARTDHVSRRNHPNSPGGNVKYLSKLMAVAGMAIVAVIPALGFGNPALAASRDGRCDSGEFCYYYNSDNAGSVSDFTGSLDDYGTAQPSCYDFKGAGNSQGVCVKNNAASVWNRSSKAVRVYFNSGYSGSYQEFAAGAKANLNSTLKNEN